MTPFRLIEETAALGIRLNIDNGDILLQGEISPGLVQTIRQRKSALLDALTEIREMAGDDWDEIVADARKLRVFVEVMMISEMRSHGATPDHYTATTECRHCGPVPIWEGCPPEILGCPWCFNRMRGLPIPTVAGRIR